MKRIRLTQVFPFLLPLRKKQRKLFFYIKMKFDSNHYAINQKDELLEQNIYQREEAMVNEASGYDIKYQYNKIHNLKLAAQVLNGLIIKPNETFSFWQVIRHADKKTPFKNGLILVNEKITEDYGGGLCQLSNLLYRAFLHSDLTIVERAEHAVESFASQGNEVYGINAAISEGWLDLKVRNDTEATFQIAVDFPDETIIRMRLLSDLEQANAYQIYNLNNDIHPNKDKFYREVSVWRTKTNLLNKEEMKQHLYTDKVEIGYKL